MKKSIKILLLDNEGKPSDKNLLDLDLKNLKLKYDLTIKLVNENNIIQEHKNEDYDITFLNVDATSNGLAILEEIVKIKPSHYVVILMNVANPEIVRNFIKSGANGFINKPFTINKFFYELEKFNLLKEDKQPQVQNFKAV